MGSRCKAEFGAMAALGLASVVLEGELQAVGRCSEVSLAGVGAWLAAEKGRYGVFDPNACLGVSIEFDDIG